MADSTAFTTPMPVANHSVHGAAHDAAHASKALDTRFLGRVDYLPTYEAMQAFTAARSRNIDNENNVLPNEIGRSQLWICEHPSVFTQGLAGLADHVLSAGSIPVVQTNRGGQVTYHGPGQVVAYPLIDLKAAGYFVKEYVFKIEEAVIKTLAAFNVTGHRVRGAPGIYVRINDPGNHARLLGADGQPLTDSALKKMESDPINSTIYPIGKIAALGIKVSRHFTYHGVALNVAMDLEPFSRINPCGYAGLQTVDLRTIGVDVTWQEAANVLSQKLATYLAS
jgi:lipoyl(octanoyl) transferase